MTSDPIKYYAMQCPHCKKRLKVSSKDLGKKRACPSCKQTITIGQAASATAKSKPSPPKKIEAAEEFAVDCEICGTMFYAKPSDVGKTIDCPDCLSEHLVKEAPKKKTVVSKPVDDGDEYTLAPADHPVRANVPDPDAFHIRCKVCTTSIVAHRDQLGGHLDCPDCGTPALVVEPKKKKKRKIELSKEKIGIEQASDLSVQRDTAKKKIDDAYEEEVEKLRQRPSPPKQPFFDGVYSYPFHKNVGRVWGILSPLGAAVASLLVLALNAEEGSQFFAILMMMIAAALGLVFLLCTGFTMVTLLNSTAMGYPNPEEWPRIDWGEWFGATLYIVSAGCISTLPSMLFGGALPPLLRSLCTVTLLFVFFPFLLLSMMDADSPAMPFSIYVWQTLGKRASAWIKFYLSSAILLAIVRITAIGCNFLGLPGVFVLTLVLMFTMTIYFRLLGRLAWVLDQDPITTSGEKSTPEEEESELVEA